MKPPTPECSCAAQGSVDRSQCKLHDPAMVARWSPDEKLAWYRSRVEHLAAEIGAFGTKRKNRDMFAERQAQKLSESLLDCLADVDMMMDWNQDDD